jgi:hypothetical protein
LFRASFYVQIAVVVGLEIGDGMVTKLQTIIGGEVNDPNFAPLRPHVENKRLAADQLNLSRS